MAIKVLLDAGHGQGSAHNRGYKGTKWKNEGDGNFHFTLLLKKELEKYGIQVGLTRTAIGQNPPLSARGKAAKGYDLFISNHTNAGGGTGGEIYEDVNARATTLAKNLCSTIASTLGIANRGVKYRYKGKSNWYGVLYNNLAKAGMLIEYCFHDKQSDVDSYEKNATILAGNVASTIASHYGLKASNENKPTIPNKGDDDVDYSKRAVISYFNKVDLKNAMPLIEFLEGDYIVDIVNATKGHEMSGYAKSNWRIAIGGKKEQHSSYMNYLIAGKNREETKEMILDFRNNGNNRKNYKL